MIFVYVLTSIVINSKKKDEPEEDETIEIDDKNDKNEIKMNG